MTKRGTPRWPAAAARLAELLPPARLHPAVLAWAAARPKAEPWAVALSGGSDSVALLLLLWAHWPARRARLSAYHFDHRLRGAASAADARFCARACAALGVPLVAGRRPSPRPLPGAAEAREARFAFLAGALARRKTKVLWLGHQQDDIAETLLMRLARGSGTAGLAAPRPVHAFPPERRGGRGLFHLRPLLTLKKAELAAALRAAGAAWREDASNAGPGHFRNRVRAEVIPAWVQAAERDALAGAARSRELLEEDQAALEAWVDALAPVAADLSLSVSGLAGRPRAVVRRALHRWLLAQRQPSRLSRQGFDGLLRAVEAGAPVRHSLGSHGFAVIRAGKLRFQPMRKPSTPH